MLTGHIREALAQVRQLQQAIVTRQPFRGYSGPARAVSGTGALAAAAIMASDYYPRTAFAHFVGWGAVFVFCVAVKWGGIAVLVCK